MKEFECPSCGEKIPDDSIYCDMCGVELLVCISCGATGTGNFCGACGGAMVSRKNAVHSTAPVQHEPPKAAEKKHEENIEDTSDDAHSTGKGSIPKLRFRDGNMVILPRDGAIIGRKEGEYSAQLKNFDLISRRHGQFIKKGRTWYLVDFGSTNGCLINDKELEPDVPMPFKKGDVIDIGTYIFDVV